jgi:hypothetical protein
MSEPQIRADWEEAETHNHRHQSWMSGRPWWGSEADWGDWWGDSSQWGAWWRADKLDALGWAVILLWAALVVVAENTTFGDDYEWWSAWGVFWVGVGAITLVEAVFRLAVPRYRAKWGWKLFWGLAFLALGLGQLAGPVWLAVPLVAGGTFILIGTLTGSGDKRKPSAPTS